MKPCECSEPHERRRIVLTGGQSYNHDNPLRIETAAEAAAIDERIAAAWASHPRLFAIKAAPDFLSKAARALEVLRLEMPACCRRHVVPSIDYRVAPAV